LYVYGEKLAGCTDTPRGLKRKSSRAGAYFQDAHAALYAHPINDLRGRLHFFPERMIEVAGNDRRQRKMDKAAYQSDKYFDENDPTDVDGYYPEEYLEYGRNDCHHITFLWRNVVQFVLAGAKGELISV